MEISIFWISLANDNNINNNVFFQQDTSNQELNLNLTEP